MKTVPLTAYPRSLARRGGAKKLRANGRVPAVIYGRETQPKNLEIDRIALHDLIHHSASENLLLDLSVAEDSKPTEGASKQNAAPLKEQVRAKRRRRTKFPSGPARRH